ncbi:hypothetical protein NN561_011299 [Cricetulus griseus]
MSESSLARKGTRFYSGRVAGRGVGRRKRTSPVSAPTARLRVAPGRGRDTRMRSVYPPGSRKSCPVCFTSAFTAQVA